MEDFSTPGITKKTLARLLFQSGSKYFNEAVVAFAARDYPAGMQCSQSAIYDFKLASFNAWEQGLRLEETDVFLQRSELVLYTIKAHFGGKTAEDAAASALASGEHANSIFYAQEAISHYRRYHKMTIPFDAYVTFLRTQLLLDSRSQDETRWIHANFININDTEQDCARTTAFLHRVRSEMWLQGARELRMLLHRNGVVPLEASRRVDSFL